MQFVKLGWLIVSLHFELEISRFSCLESKTVCARKFSARRNNIFRTDDVNNDIYCVVWPVTRLKQLAWLKSLQLSKDEKSAIMSDEVYMTRTNNAINTETERRVKATQVIVSVTKEIRSARIAFAIEYKREKMRHFKFTQILETTTGPPIVNVSYAYQTIPTNKRR